MYLLIQQAPPWCTSTTTAAATQFSSLQTDQTQPALAHTEQQSYQSLAVTLDQPVGESDAIDEQHSAGITTTSATTSTAAAALTA